MIKKKKLNKVVVEETKEIKKEEPHILFPEDKMNRLKKIMQEGNKEYGYPILKFAKDELPPTRTKFNVDKIDTLTGGLPSKRFSIVWGAKGTGKTTLCYLAIAQAQREGKLCLFINQEGTFEGERAKLFGVDLDNLVVAGPFDNAEQAMDLFILSCKEKAADLIVLDSIQAMSPKGEQETKKGKGKSVEEDEMALLARKMSKFLRMSTSGVYKGDVTVLLVGQTRTSLGGFVALDTLSGGHALSHWSTITLKLSRGSKADSPVEKIKVEDEDHDGKKITIEKVVGYQCLIKLEKVKISGSQPEGSETRIPYFYISGFLSKNN